MSCRAKSRLLASVLLATLAAAPPPAQARTGPRDAILASSVVGGALHSCALTTTGGVECWGNNADGELGNGSVTASTVPVNVTGLASGVVALAAGAWHTCALLRSGGVECWGDNELGQLGDGTTTNRTTPVSVYGLASGVAAVSAGQLHTCVLRSAGGVECWGYNGDGELGNGTTTDEAVPVAVSSLTAATQVSAGGYHTCALTSDGAAHCWGANDFGDLGDGTTTTRTVPMTVVGLDDGVATIAAGGLYTCAVTDAGGAQCWGYNRDGELGDGTGVDSDQPVDVAGLTSGMANIAAGLAHTCAVTIAGAAECWGDGEDGDLGDGADAMSLAPVAVNGLSTGVASMGVGEYQSCAVLTSGSLSCWGSNTSGQVGDGTTVNRLTPVPVNLGSTVVVRPPVGVSLGNASTYEGDKGSHLVEVPVTLSGPATSTVTVGYGVYRNKSVDTATANLDYVPKTGTLTFTPGSTVSYVPASVIGDTTVEANETFSIMLTSASSNATLVRKTVRITITNDDPQTGTRVTVGNAGIVEGNTVTAGATNAARFHVVLSRPVAAGGSKVVVGYTVVSNTATGCVTVVPGCD
ncbi:MAG TPA: Calx-beta domain-containing protein, partial [Acidimicrobiia bacterium]